MLHSFRENRQPRVNIENGRKWKTVKSSGLSGDVRPKCWKIAENNGGAFKVPIPGPVLPLAGSPTIIYKEFSIVIVSKGCACAASEVGISAIFFPKKTKKKGKMSAD